MKTLMNHMKTGQYKSCYLFFGEEAYLKRLYEQKIKDSLLPEATALMNFDTFEGKSIEVQKVADAINTLPFMNEYRLVMVKNSGLFALGRKEDTGQMVEALKEIPETTILVFIEENVDKRNSLYKYVQKSGYPVDFKTPKESELIGWVIKLFQKDHLVIDKGTAQYFLNTVSFDMSLVVLESNKLIGYKNGGGTITTADIDQICTKSLEARIFDLVDALGHKKADRAMKIYNNLMLLKESPIMVLTMVARQLRLILQCAELKDQGAYEDIASRLGIRSFVARECMNQSRNFSKESLLNAIKDCYNTDQSIKTGRMGDRLAVEMLIVKYAS